MVGAVATLYEHCSQVCSASQVRSASQVCQRLLGPQRWLGLLALNRSVSASQVRSAGQALFGDVPFFHISHNYFTIILVSAYSSYLALAVSVREVSCVGYIPLAKRFPFSAISSQRLRSALCLICSNNYYYYSFINENK